MALLSGIILLLLAVPVLGIPSAVRDFDVSCVSSTECYTTRLDIDPGATPPFAMIVREVLPPGWSVIDATWNGEAITTNRRGVTNRWAFSELVGEPVATGTLEYVTCPAAAVEPSYGISGDVVFESTNTATTGADVLMSRDQDDDGMPDDWESRHFDGSPTAAMPHADADSDNASNAHEYHSRTDPRDPLSFFGFTAITADEASLVFRWRAAAGSVVELVYHPRLTEDAPTQYVYYAEHLTESEKESPAIPVSLYPPGFFRVLLYTGR